MFEGKKKKGPFKRILKQRASQLKLQQEEENKHASPPEYNVFETQKSSAEKRYYKKERDSGTDQVTSSSPSVQNEPIPQCEISLKQESEEVKVFTQSEHDTNNDIDHESIESTPTVPTRQNVEKLDPTPQHTTKPESPPQERRKRREAEKETHEKSVKLLPDNYSSQTSKLESQAESNLVLLKDKEAIEEEEFNQLIERLQLEDEEIELLLKKMNKQKAGKKKTKASPKKSSPTKSLKRNQEESKTEKARHEEMSDQVTDKTIATQP